MKLLMVIADGFEDTEAIATLDVLERGKIDVDLASLMKRKEIVMKSNLKIMVPYLIEEINYQGYDGIIIPGGPASFKIMPQMPIVFEMITYFVKNKKLVAAICAAPHLIGKLGYLNDHNYTVHPGFEDQIIGGNYLKDEGVVVDKNIITAKSMFYSIEFGLAIYKYFYGEEKTNILKKACQGEK